MDRLDELFGEWEKWGAELMESHISYPMLSYYRSPHTDQSWLTGMAVVMDTCALRLAGAGGMDEFQAEATFSICLRALRGIGEILRLEPRRPRDPRLTPEQWNTLRNRLRQWGLPDGGRDLWPRLSRTRDGYEPLLAAFADYLVMELPEWVPASMISRRSKRRGAEGGYSRPRRRSRCRVEVNALDLQIAPLLPRTTEGLPASSLS